MVTQYRDSLMDWPMSFPTEGISGILYIGGGGGAGIAMNVAMTMGKGDWMSTGILEID